MRLWDRIKELWGSGNVDELRGASSTLHVIDGEGWNGTRGREAISPRDQFALLKKLEGFVAKEKIKAVVLLVGRPLREAPDGGTYKSVEVCYAETPAERVKRALDLAGRRGLIITSDAGLEQQARSAGLETLRTSTLRKVLDEGPGRKESSGRSSGRGGRRRSRRGGRGPAPSAPAAKSGSGEEKSASAGDGVSDLIDLV